MLFFILFCTKINSQSFTMSGGIRPNNLKGSHLEFFIKDKIGRNFSLGIEYRMVKYDDKFFISTDANALGFHKRFKNNKTIIDFPELERGYVFGDDSDDWRARNFNHSFSCYFGCNLFKKSDFLLSVYAGTHISFQRWIVVGYHNDFARVKIQETSPEWVLDFIDYEVSRTWDIGAGSRLDLEYFIFKNVSIGLNASVQMDFIAESIDFVYGGLASFYF